MSLDAIFNTHDSREAYQLLKAVFEEAIDGIIIIDDRGLIEAVNPAAAQQFGYSPGELIGLNVRVLMGSPHRERHDDYIENYKRTGVARIIGIGREVLGLRKSGEEFPFRLSVSEVHASNRRLFTGFIHDVSDLNQAKEQLAQMNAQLENLVNERTESLSQVVNKLLSANRQLEHEVQERQNAEAALRKQEQEIRQALNREKELGELKSRFVSMASHEFRTPLTTILSSVSLLARYLEMGQTEKGEKHIDRIKSAVHNLTGILNDFLSLSRLEEGKIELQAETFYWNEYCTELLEELEGILKPGQKIVHQPLAEDLQVHLDRRLIKNVFYNLVSNASKYAEPGTQIECRNRVEDNHLILEIEDHGIGIPPEDQAHLFTRFFRASNALNIKGTGLGLNIVRRYVQMLGGDISFRSTLGQGSVFTVSIPIQ
ncbi:MAG: PAS domain-containing sensor histidine kinase [Bacteroidetes bacterium]|nr:MAG: PAS domain-containing sensor histidine kinase [Bacteroidota bacterium]